MTSTLDPKKQKSGMKITQMSLDVKPDQRLSLKQSLATIKYKELQSNSSVIDSATPARKQEVAKL